MTSHHHAQDVVVEDQPAPSSTPEPMIEDLATEPEPEPEPEPENKKSTRRARKKRKAPTFDANTSSVGAFDINTINTPSESKTSLTRADREERQSAYLLKKKEQEDRAKKNEAAQFEILSSTLGRFQAWTKKNTELEISNSIISKFLKYQDEALSSTGIDATLGFGKYKDATFAELWQTAKGRNYLEWMESADWCYDDVRATIAVTRKFFTMKPTLLPKTRKKPKNVKAAASK